MLSIDVGRARPATIRCAPGDVVTILATHEVRDGDLASTAHGYAQVRAAQLAPGDVIEARGVITAIRPTAPDEVWPDDLIAHLDNEETLIREQQRLVCESDEVARFLRSQARRAA